MRRPVLMLVWLALTLGLDAVLGKLIRGSGLIGVLRMGVAGYVASLVVDRLPRS